MNVDEKMAAYSKEIGLWDPMSIDSLIDSHRKLRQANAQTWDERQAEMQKAREYAAADARKWVTEHEYVSVERLRTMTLTQIVELINELSGY